MRATLIGDVHANLPALEAVLKAVRRDGIRTIWHVGDAVGYGAFPDECVRLLRKVCSADILGNYDRKILQFPAKKARWKRDKAPDKYFAFQWAYEHLSPGARDYLASLPEQVRLDVQGRRILLTHGSPVSPEEHLRPDTPEARLAELARGAEADIVVCGHSHEPFHRLAEGVHFINTGSVGRPEGGDARACFAVLTLRGGKVSVAHRRIVYDVARAAAAIRRRGLPEAFAEMISRGWNLDVILAGKTSLPSPPDEDRILAAATALAERCRYEAPHAEQVTRLSLKLFDGLKALHKLGSRERFWLRCGGLLHDIGFPQGRQGHHKRAMRIILADRSIPLDDRQRQIVACLARFHRKTMPGDDHTDLRPLAASDRRAVLKLAALLRLADALDRTHGGVVENVLCRTGPKRVVLRCLVRGPAVAELEVAARKGDLFERVFRRSLALEVQTSGRKD